MKFLIERTSCREMGSEEAPAPGAVRAGGKLWQIEIASLEELVDMILTLEEPLILSHRKGPDAPPAIEIYDDMREN